MALVTLRNKARHHGRAGLKGPDGGPASGAVDLPNDRLTIYAVSSPVVFAYTPVYDHYKSWGSLLVAPSRAPCSANQVLGCCITTTCAGLRYTTDGSRGERRARLSRQDRNVGRAKSINVGSRSSTPASRARSTPRGELLGHGTTKPDL